MSGPTSTKDELHVEGDAGDAAAATFELLPSRQSTVGGVPVRRALPRRAHRTVGAWCFADHMGPTSVTETRGVDIGPHPHIGLQTVTWLAAGEVLHRDSLGSEQLVRAGQLNLMTAGSGVAHAEEATGRYRGELHGIQLWVAQPESTRHGDAAFEHHAALPQLELANGTATVIVGSLAGTPSPARRDTDHTGAELLLRPGESVVPLPPEHEHALIVLAGTVAVDGHAVRPGALAYLGTGRSELALSVPPSESTRVLLLGGAPFEEQILMFWNYVARTRDEVTVAHRSWESDDGRFGEVASLLPRIPSPRPPWG